MKKLVILSPDEIDYVSNLAKRSTTGVKGNFSKALRHIIHKYREVIDETRGN